MTLEAARILDGGRQFFTRAFDYGFSKSADEAFAHWPREEVLRDVVSVIRTYRPQVIISVWAGTPRDGHGQHQASGMLANEAFDAAADPRRFSDLQGIAAEPWIVDKLYHRLRGAGSGEAPLTIQTGTFDPLLGRSYHQLAMESRSKHRSQEMGAAQALGERTSGLQLVQSRVGGINSDTGIFAGVDTTLAGLVDYLPADAAPAVARSIMTYRMAIQEAGASLDAIQPSRAAGPLARAYLNLEFAFGLIRGLGDSAVPLAEALAVRAGLVRSALLNAASVVIDVRAGDDLVVAGEDVSLDVQLWNGGPFRIDGAVLRSAGGSRKWVFRPSSSAPKARPRSLRLWSPVKSLDGTTAFGSGTVSRLRVCTTWECPATGTCTGGPETRARRAFPETLAHCCGRLGRSTSISRNWANPFTWFGVTTPSS